jgi:iron complex transport system substrate-binding protein
VLLLVFFTGCTSAHAKNLPERSDTVPSPSIVCLSSDTAELLVIIGAGDHVIGVPESLIQNQPELLQFLPNAVSVGDAKRPDNERILELKPDMVMFISAMRPATAGTWEAAGIRAVPVESHKAGDLPTIARELGTLTGHDDKAREYALFCEETLALVSSRIPGGRGSGPVIYIESYSDYVAYGNVSAADSVITMLNSHSLSGQVFSNATRISNEWLVTRDPDFIIKCIIPDNDKTMEGEYARLLDRPGLSTMRAAEENRVFVVNGNFLFSPHAPVGMVYLAKAVYPDEFADVDPDAVLQNYHRRFLHATETGSALYPVLWRRSDFGVLNA